eukprot:scaffold1183_cov114-Cylindrotheca_fusiformis.AAC.11
MASALNENKSPKASDDKNFFAFRSGQISLPLKQAQHATEFQVQQELKIAFQEVVESSQFFIQTSPSQVQRRVCTVPVLGDHIEIELDRSNPSECVLKVEGSASGNDEFGWICVEFYENKEHFQHLLDTSDLRTAVIDHFNAQPPHPGFPANSAKLAASSQIQQLFEDGQNIGFALSELKQQGYVVLENGPKSTVQGHDQLTKFLNEKTNQGGAVRTDTVHFLHRDQAIECGFQQHYDSLMGIASFLNEHLDFDETPHNPMGPATPQHPLTIPDSVQLAEYGEDDFYKAHSDNSLTDRFVDGDENGGRIRHNFRHYTCILYCNDDWDEDEDGGALRLYPYSQNLLEADDAIHQSYGFVDISPKNGRLLIFDSRLIHSVERVTTKTKRRRALTLWINRPNDSGVLGESFY